MAKPALDIYKLLRKKNIKLATMELYVRHVTSLSTGNKLLTSCSSKRDAINWPPAASHGVRAIEIPTTRNNNEDS